MAKINVKKESNYKINSVKLKKVLQKFLTSKKVPDNAEVSIAFVSESTMKSLGEKYLGEKPGKLHNVLSFTEGDIDKEFINPPDDPKSLGEVVICYPVAENEAKEDEISVAEKIESLAMHGLLHLLGIHHDH